MDAWQTSANGNTGNANSVVNFYAHQDNPMFIDSTNSEFKQSGYGDATKIWVQQGKVPFLSLTTGSQSMISVANGNASTFMNSINEFAADLSAWVWGPLVVNGTTYQAPSQGREIYIRLDWEPNGTWYDWSPKQTSCAVLQTDEVDYVKAWQDIRDAVMAPAYKLSSANVQWVYSVYYQDALGSAIVNDNCTQTVTPGPSDQPVSIYDMAAAMYPGWEYNSQTGTWSENEVDWVALDGYGYCSSTTPDQILGPMFSELGSATTDKPLAVTEVGASTESNDNSGTCKTNSATLAAKQTWINDYFAYLENTTFYGSNQIKMSLWFNDNVSSLLGDKHDWSVFASDSLTQTDHNAYDQQYAAPSGATYSAYSEYQNGTASSYFFGSPNPNANVDQQQIISTTEFQGAFTP